MRDKTNTLFSNFGSVWRIVAFSVLGSVVTAACTPSTPGATVATPPSAISQDVESKKNVVFILVDDLGYSDIGIYNPDSFYETPNIDALARRGVMFTNGYAANPVCSPSRAAILTGKHPTRTKATEWFHINNYPHRTERFRHGLNNDFMANDELTMAEIYKADGYRTAFVGKWHLGESEDQLPQYQGFDVNIAGAPFGFPRGGFFSPYNNPALEDGPEGEYLTDRLTSESINLIRDYAQGDDPFFLYLSFYTVHVPLEAPQPLIDAYSDKAVAQGSGEDFGPEDQYHISAEVPRETRIRQNLPVYAAMIEKLDDNVGRLLDALEETGQADNTIIVFTSDNGGLSTSEGSPTSNIPLRAGKGWLYEGGIRVPFIVHVPGAGDMGRTTDLPAVGMDFLPTLTTLTNTALPVIAGMDGEVLELAKAKATATPDRTIFWHYPHYSNQGGFPGAAVREGRFKLLENFEDGSLQLYDLVTDISESRDIKTDHPDVVRDLRAKLHAWYEETDAEFLRPREDAPDVLPWRPGQDGGE